MNPREGLYFVFTFAYDTDMRKTLKNFKLSPKAATMLRALAIRAGTGMTAVLEGLIRREAEAKGIHIEEDQECESTDRS